MAARALKDLTHETPSCREFVDKDNQSKVAKPIILFIPGGLKRSFDLCVNQTTISELQFPVFLSCFLIQNLSFFFKAARFCAVHCTSVF